MPGDDLKIIDATIAKNIYQQQYGTKETIGGIELKELPLYANEDGDFSEIIRVSEEGTLESFPAFKLKQLNRTKILPGNVKAWHVHSKQDEIWYVMPRHHLIVGLWDIRKDSATKNQAMRVVLGNGKSQLLYIPKGVAHGSLNASGRAVELLYIVNQQFDKQNPDEYRLPWNTLGEQFWQPKKD